MPTRTNRFSTLSLRGVFTLLIPSLIAAQTGSKETPGPYEVPPVVITANRYEQPLSEVSANITVLSTTELQLGPGRNAIEALGYTPGFVVRRTGGLGARELISIQGSEHRHVTVLLDGIPLNNLSEGLADLVQVPMEQAARVEMVKGPASSAWGSALGGVVQVITPPVDQDGHDVLGGATMGTWGSSRQWVRVSGPAQDAGYLFSLSHQQTDGFRPRSTHDGLQGFGKIETATAGGRLGLSFASMRGDTEDFQLAGQPFWKQHTYSTRYVRVYHAGTARGMEARIQGFGIWRNDEVDFLDAATQGVTRTGEFKEPTKGISVQVDGPEESPSGRWSGGADARWLQADFSSFGGPGEKGFRESGGYVNWTSGRSRFVANAGVRYDDHSLYGSQWSPSAGLVAAVPEAGGLVRANVARGFGALPLSAAFLGETDFSAPNPNLQAEKATAYNLGLEARPVSYAWLKATWYRNDVKDAIAPAVNAEGKAIRKNTDRQRRTGVELETKISTPWSVELFAGSTFNDVTNTDSDAIINGTAKQTNDAAVSYRNQRFSADVWVGGHYATYDISDRLQGPPTNFTAEDSRFIWDLKLAKTVPTHHGVGAKIHIAVRNLLDDDFWWLTPFPLPGRSFEVGLELAPGF